MLKDAPWAVRLGSATSSWHTHKKRENKILPKRPVCVRLFSAHWSNSSSTATQCLFFYYYYSLLFGAAAAADISCSVNGCSARQGGAWSFISPRAAPPCSCGSCCSTSLSVHTQRTKVSHNAIVSLAHLATLSPLLQ